ncbi:MAG: hypothetical protein KDN19_07325 [Verrucomicrobiae bacterium]|nr:hypothetical protein [Verrucomicrobiae bacterium]
MRKQLIGILAISCGALGLIVPSIILGTGASDPNIPVGTLTAFPTQVQTGTHPNLTWDISYPESVEDIVEIEPPGTVIPNQDLHMEVRIVGASVKRVWLNQYGQVVDWEWVNTECQMKIGSGSYSRIFYGKQSQVNPNTVVDSRDVDEGTTIDFGGRYVQSNGSWSTWFSSTNCENNVIALKDGDNPPDVGALYGQQTVEDFLRPYMDTDGNIDIGPKDVIYLVELTHTNMNDGGFDLQDLVILVTFSDPVGSSGSGSSGSGSSGSGGYGGYGGYGGRH